jgi:uncharacterized protein (DUF433 family)
MARRRWQIDLRPAYKAALVRARQAIRAGGIESCAVIPRLPSDEQRRPEADYHWLVAAPHPWRKQLSIKGRRLTAGQLVSWMEANGDSIEDASADWDLPVAAVAEAVEYVAHNRKLVEAEFAEDRRRVQPFLTSTCSFRRRP